MNKKWTSEEVLYLKANYNLETDIVKIAEALSRTINSIKHKASRLDLKVRDGKAKIRKVKDSKYWYICKDRKPIFIHRLLAEKIVKRHLTSEDVVHHINGNSLDNRKSNLFITTRRGHMLEHMQQCIANLPQSRSMI